MADKVTEYSTSKFNSNQIGDVLDGFMRVVKSSRVGFERRWYDNNFFDDGYHFRYLSRVQNKIVDLADRSNLYNPLRAIPKASRQIRGVANLLAGQDPTPVVYPEKVSKSNFPNVQEQDTATGQIVEKPNPEYLQALEIARLTAKRTGHWLQEEFKNQDLTEKLALMLILTAKHGVSYLQVWPDPLKEKIETQVYDAFDIYLMGDMLEIYDCPFIIKTSKQFLSQIQANEMFDQAQVAKIHPDNRHASSDIKEAYMASRFGRDNSSTQSVSLILKEAFVKEYLDSHNMARIRMQDDGEQILKKRKEGDIVIRQIFCVGNIYLRDKYTNLPDYPFVDLRLEPGPIYQVPLIERFIPQNKAYDMIFSRLERLLHTSTMGIIAKQQGQQFEITNEPSAQVIEYTGVAPQWLGMPQVPSWVFSILGITQSNMEEQGVTTTTLGKLPTGVRANAAIESLKESEIANLAISSRRYKGTIKRIAEKMLDLADDYFVIPQTVYLLEKGEPQYFDIVGNQAYEQGKKLKENNPFEGQDLVPLKKDYVVNIEIETQLAYTQEGKKAAAKELGDMLVQLAGLGVIPPEAVALFWQQLLKEYNFGPTEEIMEKMDEFIQGGGASGVEDETIQKIKVGLLEVIKDISGSKYLPDEEQRISETKVGVAEVMKDMKGKSKK